MKRGPKLKPTTLKRLHGTFNVTRDGKRGPEPLAPGVLLDPPEYLTEAQALRYREILADAPANLLRRWDAPTLAGYVIAESAVIEANKLRQAEGTLFAISSHGDVTLDASLKIQARFLPLMRQFGSELGFSPASRTGLKIEESPSDDPDAERWREFDRITRRIEGREPLTAEERRRNAADDRRHKRFMARMQREAEERRAREAAKREEAMKAAGNTVGLPPPGMAKAEKLN